MFARSNATGGAFLEDPNCCAVCLGPVHGYTTSGDSAKLVDECRKGKRIPMYFCRDCFTSWRTDIDGKAPWLMMLLGVEKARRKRRNRLIKAVGAPQIDYINPGTPM